MIPPRAHVGLYKALISIWVIGMCIRPIGTFIFNSLIEIYNHLGPVQGTSGGVFDSIRVGVRESFGTGALQQAEPALCAVAVLAAVNFLRSPVPRVLRRTFKEDIR